MTQPHAIRNSINRGSIVALMTIILIAGIGFRLWNVGSQPMWLDEAYSAYAISKSFAFIWDVVPRYETHPPFYYTLLWLWSQLWGDGLQSLRALGVVCGLATIGAMAIAAREVGRQSGLSIGQRQRLMLVATMLLLFAPMLVQMAREVRPYPVLILVYTIAIVALFRLSQRVAAGGGIGGRSFAAYLLMLALVLWLHNLGPLYAAALGSAFLALCFRATWSRRDWIAFLIGHLVVFAIWLPALAILADQAPTWIKSTWVEFPPAGFAVRLVMLLVAPKIPSVVAAVLLTISAVVHMGRDAEKRRALAALLLLSLTPVALSVAISMAITPVFIIRTMTATAIPALLLFALGFAMTRGWNRWLATLALVIIMAQMASVCINSRLSPPPEQWYRVIHWLQHRMGPGDIVLTYPNEGSLPFDRAVGDLRAGIPSHPIPVAVPAFNVGGWYPTGSRGVVSLPRERLRAIAQSSQIRAAPTIWLIRMGPWAYDKGNIFVHELARDRIAAGHLRTGVIDVVGLQKVALPPKTMPATAGR